MDDILKSIIDVFSSITLIDVTKDQVTFFDYDNSLVSKEVISYADYYEKIKKIIHPDFIGEYFNLISINNVANAHKKFVSFSYQRLSSSLSYDNYIDVVKVVGENKILILSLKSECDNQRGINNEDLNFEVSELIIKVEDILENTNRDNYEINNLYNYLGEVINDIKIKNKSVLKLYEEKVIASVNKIRSSLLVIDDDKLTRGIIKKVFENDYNMIDAANGQEAVDILEANYFAKNTGKLESIVGIFLDIKMPIMDGFGVLDYLKEKRIMGKIPVIIISADDAKDTKEKVYSYEISDMIEKPFNLELIRKRVDSMVSMYAKSNYLNEIIKSQQSDLKKIVNNYATCYLIDYQKMNSIIGKIATILLENYGKEKNTFIDVKKIVDASKYYDIALNMVPRKYLENVQNLLPEEKDVLFKYPLVGVNILKSILDDKDSLYIKYANNIVKMRNERYDGLGFPNKLKQDEIPYYVYIINLSIEYAGYHMQNKSKDEIIEIIKNKNNSKYSNEIIEIFEKSVIEL